MTDRFERFSLAMSEIYRCWHKIAAEELADYGLKSSHAVYLTALARCPRGLTAPQLCEICGKDKADVSRMMGILTQRGMAVKEGGFAKGYGGYYRLTEPGREAAEHVVRRSALAAELAGQELGEAERESFYASLESIVANLRRLEKEGLPAEEG